MKLRGLTGAPRFKGFVGAVNHYTQHHTSSKTQVPGYFHFSFTFQRRTELINPHGLFLRASSLNYLNNFNDFPRDLCTKQRNFSPTLVNMTFFQLFGSNKVPAFIISVTRTAGEKCHRACEVLVVTMSQLLKKKTEEMES